MIPCHCRLVGIGAAAILLLTSQAALRAQRADAADQLGAGAAMPAPSDSAFAVEKKPDRLVISRSGVRVAEFVFDDPQILRPYFANVHGPGGLPLTRSHPPVPGVDAIDHDTMHPGIWLGLGDVNGHDFWRNRGRIEHVRFLKAPVVAGDRLAFATAARLQTADGKTVCRLTNRFTLAARPAGWLLVWDAAFDSPDGDVTFGDQEEMGFGARLATPLTERSGGIIRNSAGARSAAATWGQPAAWCDYSGAVGDRTGGITLMSTPANFRPSYWHNRDYGLMVANPFGRAAMKQGPPSAVTVPRGQVFRIVFAAALHDSANYDPAAAYQDFLELIDAE
jgi:hypothetical protein